MVPLMIKRSPRNYYEYVVKKFDGDECLFWPYGRDAYGRAKISDFGQPSLVHRIVCEYVNGVPPSEGMHAAHNCGKGHLGCVNPKHVRWATPAENCADRKIHGTERFGEKNHNAKLTARDVVSMRSLVGKVTQRELARQFNVSQPTVNRIVSRKVWSHVA